MEIDCSACQGQGGECQECGGDGYFEIDPNNALMLELYCSNCESISGYGILNHHDGIPSELTETHWCDECFSKDCNYRINVHDSVEILARSKKIISETKFFDHSSIRINTNISIESILRSEKSIPELESVFDSNSSSVSVDPNFVRLVFNRQEAEYQNTYLKGGDGADIEGLDLFARFFKSRIGQVVPVGENIEYALEHNIYIPLDRGVVFLLLLIVLGRMKNKLQSGNVGLSS